MRRLLSLSIFILLVLSLLASGLRSSVVRAQEICFPEQPDVAACLHATFADYWQSQGGLPVFGYPLAPAQDEWSNELNQTIFTQWTERNRLEAHPENQPPYDILLGRMGVERLAQLGRDPMLEGREDGPKDGCLWFAETGHNVCDQQPGEYGFKTYWETHGLLDERLDAYGRSLALFGMPLTEAQVEINPADGQPYLTQWFERARFEWHPEHSGEYRVLLGLLGTEVRDGQQAVVPAEPTAPATLQPTPSPLPTATADRQLPGSPSLFGVEIAEGTAKSTASKAATMGASWVRYNGIRWDKVEATRGSYDWSVLETFEADMQQLAEQGLVPAVIVRGTPAWAQKVSGSRCSAITQEALDDFATFLRVLVERYSGAPYHVQYWELGNEPDVDPALVQDTMPYGCWGDMQDTYYGGEYYAEMLKRVYPVIKQADPSAQVILGGLLLDCDPTNPPPDKDCTPGRFLEGVLRNGGGEAFDILAYHGYAYWHNAEQDWDQAHTSWQHRGGAMPGRLDFLQRVLNEYGVHKPIMVNEIALLCWNANPACIELGFLEDQANYAVRTYTRAWANGLIGAVWYTLNTTGWHDTGLLDSRGNPRPAYHTITFLSDVLNGATYREQLDDGTLERYAFDKGKFSYHISWTNDGSTVSVPLPAGRVTVYDMYGQEVAATGEQVQIGFAPLIIEARR